MKAFGVAAAWLEEGTPEAQALGAEIFELLDVFDDEEIEEIAESLATGEWVERW